MLRSLTPILILCTAGFFGCGYIAFTHKEELQANEFFRWHVYKEERIERFGVLSFFVVDGHSYIGNPYTKHFIHNPDCACKREVYTK